MNDFVINHALNECPNALREDYFKDYHTIKQALTQKSKKELAFDVIKEKGVNVGEFQKDLDWDKFDYSFYLCYYKHFSLEELTKEEFDLLKEVM